jgi:7-cyano-7-deazaguanine synthase in queuosine biosynthesis
MVLKGVTQMSNINIVSCHVDGFRSAFKGQDISFILGEDLQFHIEGEIGPDGISDIGADLLDIAASIFQVEKQISGMKGTNPPNEFKLEMSLRKPDVWNDEAQSLLSEILRILGNASWSFEFNHGANRNTAECECEKEKPNSIENIVLFSGGLDSTCGIISKIGKRDKIRLLSYYSTHQKTLQKDIAKELGYKPPVQVRINWKEKPGRGRTFYYRSFLFLSLAALLADSWKIKQILQFENGILASAIPPAPIWMMTKHTHPSLHLKFQELMEKLFEGSWQVKNPFLLKTKRQILEEAKKKAKLVNTKLKLSEIFERTETCWFHWSNRVPGDKKTPGRPCGICVPCLVRRTALPGETYEYNLIEDDIKNDPKKGIAFRSYYGFLKSARNTKDSPSDFYRIIPAAGKLLISQDSVKLKKLQELFLTFGEEFSRTYQIKE